MKRIFLLTTMLTFLLAANAQIPNFDFELWTDFGSFDDPNDWYTQNFFYNGDPELVRPSSDSYSGLYAARLENQEDNYGNIVRASMVSGNHDLDNSAGFPFTDRPNSLLGYYTYNPNDDDSCSVKVSLWKYNVTTQQRDLIGYGEFTTADEMGSYSQFTAPINYVSSLFPDTAVIEIYAGRQSGFADGSRLIIDALTFDDSPASVNSIAEKNLAIYPNPVSDFLIVNVPSLNANSRLTIFNSTGTKVLNMENIYPGEFTLSIANLSAGIYYVNVFSDATTASAKFIIEK